MEESLVFSIIITIIGIISILSGLKIVPQQQSWIVERLGKFHKQLEPGLSYIIPFIDKISYKHILKEETINVPEQAAITKDNVSLVIDGVIYVKIIDPISASYGVKDPYYAIIQLAQTTMRSEIGKIDLDKTFEERENMNTRIVNAINEAASTWGIQCMRYELKNIEPPQNVIKAMELQVAAERQKRAHILESEGKRQSEINLAEAKKQQLTLESQGYMEEKINKAKGEAEAILTIAEATANSISTVARSINENGGESAVALKIAEQYMQTFGNLAKSNNTMIIPANAADISSMVAQALTAFKSINKTTKNIQNSTENKD